jgi:hypothetical protein
MNDPSLDCRGGSLRAIADAQFPQDVLDVILSCVLRNAEREGDLVIGQSLDLRQGSMQVQCNSGSPNVKYTSAKNPMDYGGRGMQRPPCQTGRGNGRTPFCAAQAS